MVSQVEPSSKPEVIYPESDGKPMADNTKQFRWIVVIQQNLEWLFADNLNVFVAGDLLWYPVEGNNSICVAPDVLVVMGRPKGDRGSYKQWEEAGIAPQVVFEILSPGNTAREMNKKLVFYNRYGVEEYYLYDPDANELNGWLRGQEGLVLIDSLHNWTSPQLAIRFDCSGDELQLYRPDGKPFLSYVEIAQRAEQTEQQLEQTEQQLEQTEQQLEQTEQQLEQTEQQLEQERQRSQALAERLRAVGIDPDEI